MTNIPLYRAKKIDSDEYIIGYLHKSSFENITINDNNLMYAIDPSTLSISFEDMKDSEGTRIFASLSENGKGGDILTSEGYPFKSEGEYDYQAIVMMIFNRPQFVYQKISDRVRGVAEGVNESFDENYNLFTVIGIQE